jgi:hypothetical protein
MRIKNKIMTSLFYLGLGLPGLEAQETIPVAGGDVSGKGGSVSYSVGQVTYETYSGTNGYVAQGVQLPFGISVISGIEEANSISLQFSAYPNPAKNFVILKIENFKAENLTYRLFDINGKLLVEKNIEGNETRIDIDKLITAIYFMKVLRINKALSSQEIKTFKIIKN